MDRTMFHRFRRKINPQGISWMDPAFRFFSLSALVIGIAGLVIAIQARDQASSEITNPGLGNLDRGNILVFDGTAWVAQYLPTTVFELDVPPNSSFSLTLSHKIEVTETVEPTLAGTLTECRFIGASEGGPASCLVELFRGTALVYSKVTPVTTPTLTQYAFNIPVDTFSGNGEEWTISISAPSGILLLSELSIKTVESQD